MATEPEIKTSLVNLLAGIKQSDGAMIAREMANLDAFLEQGRMQLHPQLVHFLANRSYAKALMYLGGESDIPVGICGGNAKRPAQ
jgi:hypothetical protein